MEVHTKANRAQTEKIDNYISIEIPVVVRMNLLSDNAAQAREILNAILGNGHWTRSDNIPIVFALKTDGPNR